MIPHASEATGHGGLIVTPGRPPSMNRSRWFSAADRTRTRTSAEPRAERLLAVATVLAGAIAQPWIDHDVIADGEVLHVGPDRVDDAAGVGREGPWRLDRDARLSTEHEQVEMVECRRADADADVRRAPQFGQGKVVTQLEHIESAVTGDRQCAHLDRVIFRPSGGEVSLPSRVSVNDVHQSPAAR